MEGERSGGSFVGGDADEGGVCPVCGRSLPASRLVPATLVRAPVAALIRRDNPEWDEGGVVCRDDLHRYRMAYMREVLAEDDGPLSESEEDVLAAIERNEPISTDVGEEYEGTLSFGDRLSDRLSAFGGSWTFITLFAVFVLLWMAVNTFYLLGGPFDPYPFILLNLVLSTLAAIQAPIIMMSQNRQEAKDRARAEHDYEVNLKAELEIRQIHERLEHLLVHQWRRLIEIQRLQTDLIDELAAEREEEDTTVGGPEGSEGRRR